MYSLAIDRSFEADHYLVGGDWGDENEPHSHQYRVEVLLTGPTLNNHGFLLDIVDLSRELDELIDEYREESLNDRIEFEGLNPSLEHFARILSFRLQKRLDLANLSYLKIKLWEDQVAWAAYETDL